MKKALIIVASVAAYASIEAALLLTLMVPGIYFEAETHQKIIALGQFLLIPGMAALFSRIIYGPHRFGRRALAIFLCGSLGVPVAVIAGLLVIGLPLTLLIWAFSVSKILFALLVPIVLAVMTMGLLFCVRKSGKRSVEAEVVRWLAERQSGISARNRTWRTNSIRFALCIPSLIALPIFLFLPETWGLVSHVSWPHSGTLSGYSVPVPATWVVYYHDAGQADGRSFVDGLAGRGVALGGNPFRYDSLSGWGVGTGSIDGNQRTDYERWPPKPGDIFGQRMIKIGSGTLACVDYLPSYRWAPPRSQAVTITHIDCWGVGRLHARFDGLRSHLNAFYRMLDGITEVK